MVCYHHMGSLQLRQLSSNHGNHCFLVHPGSFWRRPWKLEPRQPAASFGQLHFVVYRALNISHSHPCSSRCFPFALWDDLHAVFNILLDWWPFSCYVQYIKLEQTGTNSWLCLCCRFFYLAHHTSVHLQYIPCQIKDLEICIQLTIGSLSLQRKQSSCFLFAFALLVPMLIHWDTLQNMGPCRTKLLVFNIPLNKVSPFYQ